MKSSREIFHHFIVHFGEPFFQTFITIIFQILMRYFSKIFPSDLICLSHRVSTSFSLSTIIFEFSHSLTLILSMSLCRRSLCQRTTILNSAMIWTSANGFYFPMGDIYEILEGPSSPEHRTNRSLFRYNYLTFRKSFCHYIDATKLLSVYEYFSFLFSSSFFFYFFRYLKTSFITFIVRIVHYICINFI